MKKRIFWIVWISYFVITILANIIAAVVWRENINFTIYSSVPIGSILLIILARIYYPSKLYLEHKLQCIEAPSFDRDDFILTPEQSENWFIENREGAIFLMRFYLPDIPFFLMFVLFFSDTAKQASFFIILFSSFLYMLLFFFVLAKAQKDEHAETEKERIEQERKEEQGKWK